MAGRWGWGTVGRGAEMGVLTRAILLCPVCRACIASHCCSPPPITIYPTGIPCVPLVHHLLTISVTSLHPLSPPFITRPSPNISTCCCLPNTVRLHLSTRIVRGDRLFRLYYIVHYVALDQSVLHIAYVNMMNNYMHVSVLVCLNRRQRHKPTGLLHVYYNAASSDRHSMV